MDSNIWRRRSYKLYPPSGQWTHLYFMKKYGCLYLYSQQGWESLNNTIQTFIHQSSQRGGFGSGEGKRKSYIYPLVRMIKRDLLWKTYEADKFFIHLEELGKAC